MNINHLLSVSILRGNLAWLAPALLLWHPGIGLSAASSAPNVLIILADDMGFSDAGCYGGEIATPNLDELAAAGLRFTQFYNTGRCWPTRAALLTGYYAQQVRRDTVPGIASGGRGTRPDWAPLMPALLQPLGFRTYHSGKWHVDGPRLPAGFDRSYSMEDHDRFFGPKRHLLNDRPLPPVGEEEDYYVTTAIADHAIRCLREHQERHAGEPFFHYLCFTSPHFPLQAPAAVIETYRARYRAGWDEVRKARWDRQKAMGLVNHALPSLETHVGPPYAFPEAMERLGSGEVNRPLPWIQLTEEQRVFQADKMAIHAAMVDQMDKEIGRVTDQLKAMGAWENTLILFLSDNGASAEIMVRGDGHDPAAAPGSADSYLCLGPGWSSAANTPLRRHKTWVHEGGISTPLIVHWPKGVAARGEWRHTPGHVVDLLPTLWAAVIGRADPPTPAPGAPARPGRSLLPAFTGVADVARDGLWWLHEGNRAWREGDFKVVASGKDAPWELYDLRTDRGEEHDLSGVMPERLRSMTSAWERRTQLYFEQALR